MGHTASDMISRGRCGRWLLAACRRQGGGASSSTADIQFGCTHCNITFVVELFGRPAWQACSYNNFHVSPVYYLVIQIIFLNNTYKCCPICAWQHNWNQNRIVGLVSTHSRNLVLCSQSGTIYNKQKWRQSITSVPVKKERLVINRRRNHGSLCKYHFTWQVIPAPEPNSYSWNQLPV